MRSPLGASEARRFVVALVVLVFAAPLTARESIQLKDITAKTQIHFQHSDGSSGEHYIVETLTTGIALFDYDNDGDVDVYLPSGSPLPNAAELSLKNRLFRNDGELRFTDVTEQSGLGDTGYSVGVAVADCDNDGDQDIYLSNFGPNSFYQNNGDGTFEEKSDEMAISLGNKVSAGVCFLDIENDGDLDLYVANYVDFTYQNHQLDIRQGISIYPGPDSFSPVPDNLLLNNGDGSFTDISKESGINRMVGAGMGCIAADFDQDSDVDLFVCNDSMENAYLENDGSGKFEEAGLLAGLAYDSTGESQGSMGADCADFDNDGWLDIYQTSFEGQLATLYANLGNNLFEDVTRRTSAGVGTSARVTWGVGFADFDLDRDKDIFIACGHIFDNLQELGDSSSFHQTNLLLENNRGKFSDVSATSGDGMLLSFSSRGCALGDIDNDGDVDVVVLNTRKPASFLRNDSRTTNHWLQLDLRGTVSNRDAVGTRVQVTTAGVTQTAEVHSGRGYQSHFGTRLHFGLGGHERVDRVKIIWSSGESQTIENISADRTIMVLERNSQHTTLHYQ
jgi:enediyne biosynthesis protein E4